MSGQTSSAAKNKIGTNTGNRGRGRPKGASNKLTGQIKEMILEALSEAGGVDYLVTQSAQNPAAFMTLLGKVIPLQVNGSGDSGEHVHRIEIVAVSPK